MIEYDAWFGPVEEELALDWRSLPNEDDDDDELLALTDPEVRALLGFDPAVADVEKIYDPNQPRDEGGKWTSVHTHYRVYHGTHEGALEDILKGGLIIKPLGERLHGGHLYEGPRGQSVYVTISATNARAYADVAAGFADANPVVLAIDIPASEFSNFVPDEQDALGISYRSPKPIPPEWIVSGEWDDGDEWSPIDLGSFKVESRRIYVVVDLAEWDVKKFDPNQPRDQSGRWSETGGLSPEQEAEHFKQAGFATVYHGTRQQLLDSITQHGLTASHTDEGVGTFEWDINAPATPSPIPNEGTLNPIMVQQQTSVYVTTDLARAKHYARLTTRLSGGQPVVVMARVPYADWAANAISRRDPDPSWDMGYRYKGNIKPEWIVGVAKVKLQTVYLVFMVDGVEKFDPNQPRDQRGRWTETGAGGVNIRGDMSRTAAGDTGQPVKSLDELYDRAKKGEAGFREDVEKIVDEVGGDIMYTPIKSAEPGTTLKSRQSAERKLKAELNNDPTQLRDVLRATVVNDTVEQSRVAAALFLQTHGDDVLRVKDRYVKSAEGYRDILVNYRTSSGLVAEVQFNSREMIRAKLGEGHKIYEDIRRIRAGGSLSQFAVTTGTVGDVLFALQNKSQEVYDAAYQADGNGDWSK